MYRLILLFALLFVWAQECVAKAGALWQAGVARSKITPREGMWMSGYAKRNGPARGTRQDLWAKALLLQDADGRQALLVTMDLIGIDRELSQKVCQDIQRELSIPREAIVLSASHNHSGPVVGSLLPSMWEFDETQRRRIESYTDDLAAKLVAVAKAAKSDLQPATISYGRSQVAFAVNRRNNPETSVPQLRAAGKLAGPVDHDVPVLALHDINGRLRATVFGYACHATAMDDYLWSGDWPGVAQAELEQRHPGSIAMFWAGCGGDQNPLPRRSEQLMNRYGREAANAVDRALENVRPIVPRLACCYQEIDLPLGKLPSRRQLEMEAKGQGLESYPAGAARRSAMLRAQSLLRTWTRDGELKTSYPYPIQIWRLGTDLNWVFLGGEVVVEYAVRIKQELGAEHTWVAAYSNDVMAYIPSRRVLEEGGYEGATSMVFYGQPTTWHPQIEDIILDKVPKLLARISTEPKNDCETMP